MKFRIMQDVNGKYVQKKNMFGIWRNWLLFTNTTTPLGKTYYDYSVDELIMHVETFSKKERQMTELLKEFTV